MWWVTRGERTSQLSVNTEREAQQRGVIRMMERRGAKRGGAGEGHTSLRTRGPLHRRPPLHRENSEGGDASVVLRRPTSATSARRRFGAAGVACSS